MRNSARDDRRVKKQEIVFGPLGDSVDRTLFIYESLVSVFGIGQ